MIPALKNRNFAFWIDFEKNNKDVDEAFVDKDNGRKMENIGKYFQALVRNSNNMI